MKEPTLTNILERLITLEVKLDLSKQTQDKNKRYFQKAVYLILFSIGINIAIHLACIWIWNAQQKSVGLRPTAPN